MSPEHADAWLRHVRSYLADKSTRYERVLAQVLDEFVACPDAPPSTVVHLLNEHQALATEEGRIDAALVETRRKIDDLWDRIETTKGGADA